MMIRDTLEETIEDCNFKINTVEEWVKYIIECEFILESNTLQSYEREIIELKRLRDWLLELQQLREVVKIIKEDREEF